MSIALPISVVIASLGGEAISKTIKMLNTSAYRPTEILICLPHSEVRRVPDELAGVANVQIIATHLRGQVSQRSVGLRVARCEYVLQLDDDVLLFEGTLLRLLEEVRLKGRGSIVAPLFIPDGESTVSNTTETGLLAFCSSFYFSIVCGAFFGRKRFGTISRSGIAFGISSLKDSSELVESDWIPGGAVMCHASDLILDDYYPYSGKAYSEDLIHSVLWKRQGCRFWTVLKAPAEINVSIESFSWQQIISRFRAHKYVVTLIRGQLWRTYVWFIFYCLKNLHKIFKENSFSRETLSSNTPVNSSRE